MWESGWDIWIDYEHEDNGMPPLVFRISTDIIVRSRSVRRVFEVHWKHTLSHLLLPCMGSSHQPAREQSSKINLSMWWLPRAAHSLARYYPRDPLWCISLVCCRIHRPCVVGSKIRSFQWLLQSTSLAIAKLPVLFGMMLSIRSSQRRWRLSSLWYVLCDSCNTVSSVSFVDRTLYQWMGRRKF